jgi:alanine-synthesizing transaminase
VHAPRFSRRTDWNTGETALAAALAARKREGLPVIDLTASNPTRCGFDYDADALLAALRHRQALEYDPDPRGLLIAREAVSAYYREHGASLLPEQIFLTTSTSEAYSFLFRMLCDPGDEVLIAQPSYPLFDFLADLDDVKLVPYPVFYDHGWHIDLHALASRVTPRTRAIALVHPNNPTGHFTRMEERHRLEALCAEHGLALVVDEVFLDYPLAERTEPSFAAGRHPALTVVLSGLSKIAALPQMKAAWIACFGPERLRAEAEARLEVIADTFLSMNAPIQHALPEWLGDRAGIQRQIRERTRANLARLDQLLSRQASVTRLEAEGGWYAVLRIPALRPDAETALDLVQSLGISLHPGYFFGFPESGWLVVSLLGSPAEFEAGADALLRYFQSS